MLACQHVVLWGFIMTIFTLAQTKGGAGKTTLAQVLVAELVHRGVATAAIDLDPNLVLSRFIGRSAALKDVVPVGVPGGDSRTADMITDFASRYQAVVIDLMGAATPDVLIASGFSDVVVVPSQVSEADVRCGIETWHHLMTVEQMSRRQIAKAVAFMRTSPAIKTKAQQHVRRQYERAGIPILRAELMERTALKEMGFTGLPPNLTDRQGNAGQNVIAVVDEIIGLLPASQQAGLRQREMVA